MENEFEREALIIGEENMKKLRFKKVAVFGIGGVGGNAAEALIRGGIGNLVLVDNDDVSLSNINRQVIALHSTVGQPKVEVMKKRLLDINPEANIEIFKTFYLPDNSDEFDFTSYDYVVDAIDTVSAKLDIIEKCLKANTPIISSMGTGNKLDPSKLIITDISKTSVDPLAKVMRRELRKRNIEHLKVIYSTEQPIKPLKDISEGTSRRSIPGSSAFVPPCAGIMIASEIVRYFLSN